MSPVLALGGPRKVSDVDAALADKLIEIAG
jgi:hypothetical protein